MVMNRRILCGLLLVGAALCGLPTRRELEVQKLNGENLPWTAGAPPRGWLQVGSLARCVPGH
jgi:hypothetical protein